MECNPCPISKLPRRNYQPAAWCNSEFGAAAERIEAKPSRYFLKAGRGWYNIFAVSLGSGRFATLTQWEDFPQTIEIGLELVNKHFCYENDLLEILAVLNVDIKDTSRQGAFKWKPLKSESGAPIVL